MHVILYWFTANYCIAYNSLHRFWWKLCMNRYLKINTYCVPVQKVHLDVQMVEHTIDPSAVKTKDTIESVEFKIQHLIGQMHYIRKQQDFERVRSKVKNEWKRGDSCSLEHTMHLMHLSADYWDYWKKYLYPD